MIELFAINIFKYDLDVCKWLTKKQSLLLKLIFFNVTACYSIFTVLIPPHQASVKMTQNTWGEIPSSSDFTGKKVLKKV